jgi:hypothetical protein
MRSAIERMQNVARRDKVGVDRKQPVRQCDQDALHKTGQGGSRPLAL